MNCEKCNAPRDEDKQVATIFHFWMRLCASCTKRYGEKDENGKYTYKVEATHGQ